MLYTQSIKAPRTIEGSYISVMSRHTKDDGITPDDMINLEGVEHRKILAPSPKLVGDWYKGRLGPQIERVFEEEFAPRYLEVLREYRAAVMHLGHSALENNFIIMCAEPTPNPGEVLLCHRRLLAEECLRLTNGLEVDIK